MRYKMTVIERDVQKKDIEDNLHTCARCGVKTIRHLATSDQEYGAIDSAVWETAYNATDPESEDAGWVGFGDAEKYYLCPKCVSTEEKADLTEENLR